MSNDQYFNGQRNNYATSNNLTPGLPTDLVNLGGAVPDPPNALSHPQIRPTIIDHATKRAYDQQFQELQSQLDLWRMNVDQSYAQYTALEQMVEAGERARQQLAMLQNGQPSGSISAAVPQTSVTAAPLPSASSATFPYPYVPVRPSTEVPTAARIEEIPPSPPGQNSTSRAGGSSQPNNQRTFPPNPYNHYRPSQLNAPQNPPPQPFSRPYIPHAQRQQASSSTRQTISHAPPQQQRREVVPDPAPPPSKIRQSSKHSAASITPLHTSASLLGSRQDVHSNSSFVVSPYSSLVGALAGGTKPSQSLASTSTSVAQNVPASSQLARPSSSSVKPPTPETSSRNPSVPQSNVPEGLRKYEADIKIFLEGMQWYISTGPPGSVYCSTETINAYKDQAGRTWMRLTARGQSTLFSEKDFTMETMLEFVKLWKNVDSKPTSSITSKHPTQTSKPTAPTIIVPPPAPVIKPNNPPQAVPTPAPKPEPPIGSPANGLNTNRLAKDILRALGRKPTVSKENSVTTVIPTTQKQSPSASNSTAVPLATTTLANEVDAGIIPPIAHLSPAPSPPLPDGPSVTTPAPAPPTTSLPTHDPPQQQASQPSAAVTTTPPLTMTLSVQPGIGVQPAPPLQPYYREKVYVYPSTTTTPLKRSQPPPPLTTPSKSTSKSPTKRKRLSPAVEIPIRSPGKTPKQLNTSKDASMPLFLPESSSPPANHNMEVDSFSEPVLTPASLTPMPLSPKVTMIRRNQAIPEVVIPPPPPYVGEFLRRRSSKAVSDDAASTSLRSRTRSLGAASDSTSAGGVLINELPDPEDLKLVWEASQKMTAYQCKWKDCDVVTNSGKSLHMHLRLVHGDGITIGSAQQFSFVCAWQHCGQMYKDTERLFKHFERHSIFPLHCKYEGCEETARTPRHLRQHYLEDHTPEQPIRPCPDPIEPTSLSEPLDLPPTIPPYIAAAQVVPATITKERHNVLGPWVLRQMFSGSKRPKRHNYSAAVHLSRNNPYEFLGAFCSSTKLPDLGELNSAEVSYAVNNGMVLWPAPDVAVSVPPMPEDDEIDEEVKVELDDV